MNQRACDLSHDGFCYRTFESNDQFTWNVAQSSCHSWGGNLASITSEQENNFLHLNTPYAAVDCWIGLTNMDRGDYYWVDGEALNFNNISLSASSSMDTCARAKTGGEHVWSSHDCDNTTNCYICKRKSSKLICQ